MVTNLPTIAIALAAETYLSAKKKKELTGEDTNLLHPGIAVGVITVSAGLVSTQNDVLGRVGLLFSSIAAFAIIGKYAKRFLEAGELKGTKYTSVQTASVKASRV